MNGLIREQDHRTAKPSKNEKRELQKESVYWFPTVPIGGGSQASWRRTREFFEIERLLCRPPTKPTAAQHQAQHAHLKQFENLGLFAIVTTPCGGI